MSMDSSGSANLPAPSFDFSNPIGLVLRSGMTYEEWAGVGVTLSHMEAGLNWWTGDWVNYGEHEYGEKYSQAILQTGREKHTLENLAWVAGRIDIHRRKGGLSWSHHRVVAKLPVDKQDYLLEKAERENLSVRGLEEEAKNLARVIAAPAKPAAETSPRGEPSVAADTERPSSQPAADDEEHEPDAIKEWERAEKENEALRARLENAEQALSSSDIGAELLREKERNARIEGRLQQETVTLNEAKKLCERQGKTIRAYGEILDSLRRFLSVATNGEILGAVQDLRR